ncbi:MAG: transporter, partial [Bacteroidales bacterium]
MKILQFLKNWALLLSILIGCIGHSWLIQFASIVPYILFSMLLFTFCRITPQELKFKKMHLWFLLIQIGGGLILYMSLSPFNIPLA